MNFNEKLIVYFIAPSVDVNNTISSFEKQELSKSERPELTAAKTVISGGIVSLWKCPLFTHLLFYCFYPAQYAAQGVKRLVLSVCLSVCQSVCLSVCHAKKIGIEL